MQSSINMKETVNFVDTVAPCTWPFVVFDEFQDTHLLLMTTNT
jgi:hypothetical protein